VARLLVDCLSVTEMAAFADEIQWPDGLLSSLANAFWVLFANLEELLRAQLFVDK
jgi:hypothetical protein